MGKSKAQARLNASHMMKCGMMATIIAYRNSNDMDIRFEDGYEVYHVQYSAFLRGETLNPRCLIGKENIMTCGMKAKIIACKSKKDIDVEFEDGYVARKVTYMNFMAGCILNPNVHIGESTYNKYGDKITITAYRAYGDIDVVFEDGEELKHKAYGHFKDGTMCHPKKRNGYHAEKRLNSGRLYEKKMMNCGMEAEIIDYRTVHDIDIKFTDGTIVENKAYSAFKKGSIQNPSIKTHEYEKAMMRCGMEATIIKYRKSTDIDVKFEDGFIVKHKTYNEFVRGSIVNKNLNTWVGKKKIMSCGMEVEIIDSNGANDLTIKFADGCKVKHQKAAAFEKGCISYPKYIGSIQIIDFAYRYDDTYFYNVVIDGKDEIMSIQQMKEITGKQYFTYKRETIKEKSKLQKRREAHVGEENIMQCGMKAVLIAYHSSQDVDIRFEDNAEVYHKTYQAFQKGFISHPKHSCGLKEKREGETAIMLSGAKATIVAYRRCDDIDVKFENGRTIYHTTYAKFKDRKLREISVADEYGKERIGQKNMMNCGMEAEIIAYRNVHDIDVKFEDGTIRPKANYFKFKNGNIGHPTKSKAELKGWRRNKT